MFSLEKEENKTMYIAILMTIITLIILLTNSDITRRIFALIVAFLLGLQVQKTIYIMKNKKGE